MIALVLMTEEEVAALGRRDDDAGFGALRTDRGLLPLAAMDIDARVTGVIAQTEIAQTFVNTLGAPIEATYIFPLPDRAAVHRFRMEVAGRVIEGIVDERGAAREQYDEAIAAGHRAAITEEERPGVFTLRVGNLMPGEAATVRLSLVGPLPIDDGEVTFWFPLVVAPRYIPGTALGGEQAGLGIELDTTLVPDASRISPPVLLPGCPNPVRLGIRVTLGDGKLRSVASSLHAVTSTVRDAQLIELQPHERLDRDFILRWRVDEAELVSSLVCADDAAGGTFMLTLVPPSSLAMSQKPRDVVFVLDRSGSMQGWKMQAAKRATARMIDTLTSRDRFHVIAFDNTVEVLPDARLADATDRMRYKAVDALGKVDARGGTELAQPLARAVQILAGGHDDRERVIVLVTDGQVGNEDHILREIAPNLRNVRVFTLGIDQAVNAGFLRRLAGAGGGLCELVESEDRLDLVMAKVHRRIGTPVATDLRLEAHGIDVAWNQVAPAKLPDVYAGAPVVVLGRYRGHAAPDASLAITGTSFGAALNVRVARHDVPAAAWLGPSWARAHIRELEDRYAAGARELDGEIIRVSKQWTVLSRFTAFLAVDRSAVVNKGGKLVQAVQPVESPAGWEMQTRAGTMKTAMMPMAAPMPARPSAEPVITLPPRVKLADRGAPMSASAGGPPPPPSPGGNVRARFAPPSSFRGPARPPSARRQAERAAPPPPADPSPYLAKLATLARELDAAVNAAPARLRMLWQRLVEWLEDLRSVGGFDSLAHVVDAQVKRLAVAVDDGNTADMRAIASELLAVATGGSEPPKRGSGRAAFWK